MRRQRSNSVEDAPNGKSGLRRDYIGGYAAAEKMPETCTQGESELRKEVQNDSRHHTQIVSNRQRQADWLAPLGLFSFEYF